MKKFTVSEDTEIVLDGKRILLEAGDEVMLAGEMGGTNPVAYHDADGTLNKDMVPGDVTEEQLASDGFVPGGKLLVHKDDNSVFVLLTNDGQALTLRTD